MPNDKEKINLTPKDFSFICPLSMDELTPIEGGYHCDGCEKKVYDVSHMSKSEFKTLQEKTKDLCISFKKVTTVAVALGASGWVAAADTNSTTSSITIQQKSNSLFPYGVKGLATTDTHSTKSSSIIPKKYRSIFPYGVKVKVRRDGLSKVDVEKNTIEVPFSASHSDVKKVHHLMGKVIPKVHKKDTFKLEKVKITPKDTNKTNSINTLTPSVKCDIESSIDGGDNIAPPYEEENSN